MSFRFHTTGVEATPDGDFVVIDDTTDIQNVFDGGATVMAWIYIDSYGQANFGRIVDKDGEEPTRTGWILFVDGNAGVNRLGFERIFSTTDGQWRTSNNTILTGQWYHVAVTYNSASAANDPVFYIDGQSVTVHEELTPVGTRTSDVGNPMLFGQRRNYDRAFDGRIADVRLHDRILTAAEIQTIHASRGADSNVSGLLRRYPLSPTRKDIAPNTPWIADTEQSVTNASSFALSVPTHQDGDLLIMLINAGGNTSANSPNVTTPSGWTQRAHFDFPAAATRPVMALYTRIASSEPANYTISWDQTCPCVGFMSTYPGVPETPINVATNTGTTASPVSPDESTHSVNVFVYRAAGMDNELNEPAVRGDYFASNMRGRRILSAGSGSSNGTLTGYGEEALDSAATGTRTWNGGASDEWGALTATFSFGDGIEGLPAKDLAKTQSHGETWHGPTSDEDELTIEGG